MPVVRVELGSERLRRNHHPARLAEARSELGLNDHLGDDDRSTRSPICEQATQRNE
jgi:hypothetical protein